MGASLPWPLLGSPLWAESNAGRHRRLTTLGLIGWLRRAWFAHTPRGAPPKKQSGPDKRQERFKRISWSFRRSFRKRLVVFSEIAIGLRRNIVTGSRGRGWADGRADEHAISKLTSALALS